MTSDNVLKFLGNREYLHQVSYQELKSLVVQYPYSLSLRYLLAMKSQQEDNTDLGRNIELLSTYGIDRSHLHKVFSEDPIVLEDLEETVVMGEDFLELKELSTLEREIEETQFIKTESNLNFLESIPSANKDLSILPVTPISPPTIEIDTTEELEIALDEVGKNLEKETVETAPSLILKSAPEVIEEKEEEFVEMDFESVFEKEEDIGIPMDLPEIAPSESFSAQDGNFDENGLPADAIEVNDLFLDNEDIGEPSVEQLFDESEQEAIAEEAVSDSVGFIENPKEILEKESHTSTAVEEILEEEEELIEKAEDTAEEVITEELTAKKPSIPFEISYSDTDPSTLKENSLLDEEPTLLSTPTPLEIVEEQVESSTALADLEEENLEETVENEVIETTTIIEKGEEIVEVIEKEKPEIEVIADQSEILPEEKKKIISIPAVFKFDSLDQFEVAMQANKTTKFSQPLPKAKFSSWREKYSGVSTFSSINLNPISKNGGKVIKKKKKVVQKKFKETVAFAEESLKMDTLIVSETLAQLLVKQGQYSRARTMYEELSLTMPEKSSFFAAEIEKIQNLPDEDS